MSSPAWHYAGCPAAAFVDDAPYVAQDAVIIPPPQAADNREGALQECDKLIEHFDTRARKHKRTFVRYKTLSIALTCGVTVISALQGIYQPTLYWAWVLPVVSGLAAFCTTMVHATNAQELWLRARSMTHRLTSEQFLFLQGAGKYAEEEAQRVKLFSKRLMEIWAGGMRNGSRRSNIKRAPDTMLHTDVLDSPPPGLCRLPCPAYT